jgi:hypothetical protein
MSNYPVNLNAFRGLPTLTRRQPQLPQSAPASFAPLSLHQKPHDTVELRFSGYGSDVDSDPEAKVARARNTQKRQLNEKIAQRFRDSKIDSAELIRLLCPDRDQDKNSHLYNSEVRKDIYGARRTFLEATELYTNPKKFRDAKNGAQEHAFAGFIDALIKLSNTSDGTYIQTAGLREKFEGEFTRYSKEASS